MKGKNEKVSVKEEPQDEKTETVDRIKKKYGYTLTAVSVTFNAIISHILLVSFFSSKIYSIY